jgi:hypothetical protein
MGRPNNLSRGFLMNKLLSLKRLETKSMGKFTKGVVLPILLVVLSTSIFVGSTLLPVQGQAAVYQAKLHIISPIEGETYKTNNILLNFTCETNIPESDISAFIFGGNLDGQLGYHGGKALRLGEFQKPLRNFYSIPINVSDGNHLLWVQVDIRYYSRDSLIENLSQIVSFTVDTGASTPPPTNTPTANPTSQPNTPTSTPLPSPSPTVPEFPIIGAIPLLLAVSIPLVYLKRRTPKRC